VDQAGTGGEVKRANRWAAIRLTALLLGRRGFLFGVLVSLATVLQMSITAMN
jgi:hypothetical protein